ncbi:MAG: iron ABC transporter permease [Planctomycetaceae bacterium]|jgi:iron complex transport system permease protein|nr:iron ABC transporter permease [Planctomycetaceae bacterium]
MSNLTETYTRSNTYKTAMLIIVTVAVPVMLCVSISVGAASVPLRETVLILCGFESQERFVRIIMNIRLPQALAAILAGAGLSIAGATMQGVLRNPLASPFTLGISNAAAFGAALMLLIGGGRVIAQDNTLTSPGLSQHWIAMGAFIACVLTSVMILALSRLRGSRSETILLLGVAFSSLFSAGLMFMQYVADESRLAAIVYWTFGDTTRATWNTIGLMVVCIVPVSVYFLSQAWNYNALVFGEETAQGLGVPVLRLRMLTMILASLLTALLVSLLGIIGFVGLVVPHLSRLFVGSDNRFLLPFSLVFGALLLLVADTAARLLLEQRTLPVSILTAFIGVPVFLSLLLGRRNF